MAFNKFKNRKIFESSKRFLTHKFIKRWKNCFIEFKLSILRTKRERKRRKVDKDHVGDGTQEWTCGQNFDTFKARHWDITYSREHNKLPEAVRLTNNKKNYLIAVVDDRRRSSGRREDPRRHTLGADMMHHYGNQGGSLQRSMDLEVSFKTFSSWNHIQKLFLVAFCASHCKHT